MARGVRLVSFDCYGTLFDWLYGIKGVLTYVTGEDVLDRFFRCEKEELRTHEPYSRILCRCLRRILYEGGRRLVEELGKVYCDALVLAFAKSPPFPDTLIGLELLRRMGVETAIISNTERRLIEITLAGLRHLFDHVVTVEDTGRYKPDPEAFLRAFAIMGVDPEEVLHVSSYPYYDLEPARRLSVKTLLVNRYGYEWEPSVDSLEEVARFIKSVE